MRRTVTWLAESSWTAESWRARSAAVRNFSHPARAEALLGTVLMLWLAGQGCGGSSTIPESSSAVIPSTNLATQGDLTIGAIADQPPPSCTRFDQTLSFTAGPSSQGGYGVMVLVGDFHGKGQYRDIRPDEDSANGVRIWLYHLVPPRDRTTVGVATDGVVQVTGVSSSMAWGSVSVNMMAPGAAGSEARFRFYGQWRCRFTTGPQPTITAAPSPS